MLPLPGLGHGNFTFHYPSPVGLPCILLRLLGQSTYQLAITSRSTAVFRVGAAHLSDHESSRASALI